MPRNGSQKRQALDIQVLGCLQVKSDGCASASRLRTRTVRGFVRRPPNPGFPENEIVTSLAVDDVVAGSVGAAASEFGSSELASLMVRRQPYLRSPMTLRRTSHSPSSTASSSTTQLFYETAELVRQVRVRVLASPPKSCRAGPLLAAGHQCLAGENPMALFCTATKQSSMA